MYFLLGVCEIIDILKLAFFKTRYFLEMNFIFLLKFILFISRTKIYYFPSISLTDLKY